MEQLISRGSGLGDSLATWVLEASLITLVLAILVVALCRTPWLRRNPTARHVLWLVVLAKFVLPPVVSMPYAINVGPAIATRVERDASPSRRAAALGSELHARLARLDDRPRFDDEPISDDQREGEIERDWDGAALLPDLAMSAVPAERERAPNQDGRAAIGTVLMCVWVFGALSLAVGRLRRIAVFHRATMRAQPAPKWLVAVAEDLAWVMRARCCALRVVPGTGTPRLWCLGRPVLLVPEALIKSLSRSQWQAILAHELAHLKRGDHWVSRVTMLASLVWWWNPVFWWATRSLEAEAELACDAWVVWVLPKHRLEFAEALVNICERLSKPKPQALALGAAGTGRFVERRLTMILQARVSNRMPWLAGVFGVLVSVVALPNWLVAAPANSIEAGSSLESQDEDDADRGKEVRTRPKSEDKEKDTDRDDKDDVDVDDEVEARVRKEIEKALGPDFEKKMEAMGERIAKQMETKFGAGSDFEKRMEAFGKEMETKFGPEFEKKMEAFARDFELKFGPEFQEKMEAFGREMEATFGEDFQRKMEAFGKEFEDDFGGEFEGKMKSIGDELAKELGPGSEFERKMKEYAEKVKARETKASAKLKSRADLSESGSARSKREARIERLEAQIEALAAELERLKSEDPDGDGE